MRLTVKNIQTADNATFAVTFFLFSSADTVTNVNITAILSVHSVTRKKIYFLTSYSWPLINFVVDIYQK